MNQQNKPCLPSKDKQCAFGIDIGGTEIKHSLISVDGRVIKHQSTSTPAKTTTMLKCLQQLIAQAMEVAIEKQLDLVGVGIGVPALVNNGVVVGGAENVPALLGIDLKRSLQRYFDVPLYIENDVQMVAVAEDRFGGAAEVDNVVFLTIGTGIGGAIKINGNLYTGNGNGGTEIGHMIIKDGGKLCGCGSTGCFQEYASVSALVKYYCSLTNESPDKIDGKHIIQSYLRQETKALIAMQWHFNYLAIGTANLIKALSPQKVIIGGGISEAGESYLEKLHQQIAMIVHPIAMEDIKICRTLFGNRSGSIGAAALAFS